MADYYDYSQDSAIQDNAESTRKLEQHTGDIESRLLVLERKLTRLALVNEAMFSLLGEQLQLGDAELMKRIEIIAEARKQRAEIKAICSECQHENVSTRQTCMYCGGALLNAPAISPFAL